MPAEICFRPYGNYDVAVHKSRCFVPTKKKGEDTVIPITRQIVTLRHKTGTEVLFKRFKNRGRWIWSDSRSGGVPESVVIKEVARMLFANDIGKASCMLATEIASIS